MPLSPELLRLPRIAASFWRAGVMLELIKDMTLGESERNMVEDSRLLLKELEKSSYVNIAGLENIPKEKGAIVVFNHPNMEALLPAMLRLFVEIFDKNGQEIRLAMGSEIPLTTKNFNEKTAMPGSVELLRRFHKLYSRNIISVPTAENRKDYMSGRVSAVRKIMRALNEGDMIFISPEGHVEKDNMISPIDSYHDGAGKLAILAARSGKPTIPVGIWEDANKVCVSIGEPFTIHSVDADLASVEEMFRVAQQLPENLRGPFR